MNITTAEIQILDKKIHFNYIDKFINFEFQYKTSTAYVVDKNGEKKNWLWDNSFHYCFSNISFL